MVAKLTAKERDAALRKLRSWKKADGGKAIARTFVFADFSEAFAFMTRSALAAEKLNHHPDWSNSYRTVAVKLSTHEVEGLSPRDIRLAEIMDAIAGG